MNARDPNLLPAAAHAQSIAAHVRRAWDSEIVPALMDYIEAPSGVQCSRKWMPRDEYPFFRVFIR